MADTTQDPNQPVEEPDVKEKKKTPQSGEAIRSGPRHRTRFVAKGVAQEDLEDEGGDEED